MSQETAPVTVLITCAIKPDMLETARRELAANIEMVMAREPACQGVRVHDDPNNPQRLMIIENWESLEALPAPTCRRPTCRRSSGGPKTFWTVRPSSPSGARCWPSRSDPRLKPSLGCFSLK